MGAFSPDALLVLAADPVIWVALLSLIAIEIVLGIDNLIFISIITNRLPEAQRPLARRIGIGLALVLRLGLLGTIAFIVKLTAPVFTVLGNELSWRDLILIGGGLFLVWKATKEIHHRIDPAPGPDMFGCGTAGTAVMGFGAALVQIIVLDLVFSLDSIITAVGMTPHMPVMVIAVVVTVIVMLVAATPLANFINANPTVVMLALSFLMVIGVTLIAEGFGADVPKGYIYVAMAFSVGVEALNMLSRKADRRRNGQAQNA
jgi:predicted tellurium resistance membrane protein TerC